MAERTVPPTNRKAPAFTLADDAGKKHALKDYLGQNVVLYFYPKDDTPGCTVEACDFRDAMDAIADHGAVVIGISPDSSASHDKFRKKHKLPFTLLADPDKATMMKYGAWGEKTLYGKKTTGVIRSTFLIDDGGKIVHVWPNVKAKGHVAQVIAKLEALEEA
jgi:peroxiredoxin Q/BCP